MKRLYVWMMILIVFLNTHPELFIASVQSVEETDQEESSILQDWQLKPTFTYSKPIQVTTLSYQFYEPLQESEPVLYPEPEPEEPENPEKPEGRTLEMEATAYTIAKGQVPNLKGITATGTKVEKGRTVGVDPNVIPLGSLLYIESDYEGVGGYYVAEDTGSAVKDNIVDVFFGWGGKGTDDYKDAINFGRRTITVTVVEEGDYAETKEIDEAILIKATEE